MEMTNLIKNLEDAIEGSPAGSFSNETEFKTTAEWNSLALLSVLAMIDSEYEIEISNDELKEINTVQELYDFIVSKK
ncbi:MAG: acyl carrier protein [Ignavibacteriae bacterium]|nr:acyl carrier protein [Ignavibacteriota bacterium]